MYHFTFIDEASTITEQDSSKAQENASEKRTIQSQEKKNILTKTAYFLKKPFIRRNWFRIFISNN